MQCDYMHSKVVHTHGQRAKYAARYTQMVPLFRAEQGGYFGTLGHRVVEGGVDGATNDDDLEDWHMVCAELDC